MLAKTKVKVLNLNRVLKNIEKVFTKTVTNELLSEIGRDAVKTIKGFTRKGLSLPRVDKRTLTTTRSARKQQALSPGYKNYRQRLADKKIKPGQDGYVKVSKKFFKPNKSNLSLTGQLIDSVFYKFGKKKKTVKTLKIDIGGNRDDGLSNQQVADELAERGRLFLGLDGKTARRYKLKVLRLLRRNIRNFNK